MEQASIFPEQEILQPISIDNRNPNEGQGRPSGARIRKYKVAEKICAYHTPAVLDEMGILARAGDTAAAKLILERGFPRPRYAPIEIKLPKDLRDAMQYVLQEVTEGRLPPDSGQVLTAMLKDMIIASSMQIGSNGTGPASDKIDVRERLASRLTRALELRQAAIASPAVTDLPAADPDAPDGPADG
jgi:hypothetical protein